MWLEAGKFSSKKFHEGYPLTPHIATKFEDDTPSLNTFKPNPGVKLSLAPSGVVLVLSGDLARDNLKRPLSNP